MYTYMYSKTNSLELYFKTFIYFKIPASTSQQMSIMQFKPHLQLLLLNIQLIQFIISFLKKLQKTRFCTADHIHCNNLNNVYAKPLPILQTFYVAPLRC